MDRQFEITFSVGLTSPTIARNDAGKRVSDDNTFRRDEILRMLFRMLLELIVLGMRLPISAVESIETVRLRIAYGGTLTAVDHDLDATYQYVASLRQRRDGPTYWGTDAGRYVDDCRRW